jgi:hypothetical protein
MGFRYIRGSRGKRDGWAFHYTGAELASHARAKAAGLLEDERRIASLQPYVHPWAARSSEWLPYDQVNQSLSMIIFALIRDGHRATCGPAGGRWSEGISCNR